VRLGLQTNGETEILEGIKNGELVVTSAQFLIDSESSLKEAAAKMVAPKKADSPQRHEDTKKDMQGMDMKNMKMPGKPMKETSHE